MLKRIGCRLFQAGMHLGAKGLPWRSSEIRWGTRRLPEVLRECGSKRPLVVTGPNLYRRGIAGEALRALDAEKWRYGLFCEVENDPSEKTVERICESYRKGECDGIVAIGGGSPMDAAKAAAARIARPEKSLAQMEGILKVRRKIPPLIAIPTTAGTGSETTIAAVISQDKTHRKVAISDLCLIPRFAILDEELTIGLPPQTTAQTGLDALTHAVEAYLCVLNNPPANRAMAEGAVREIFHFLGQAVANGADREARKAMLLASYRAGCAFTRSGVGNVHALAHALGGKYGIAHGLANAVLLPLVLEDYGSRVHKRLARLADVAGIPGKGDAPARAAAFIHAVREENQKLGIPDRLECIREEDIPEMADWAEREANPLYPVPVIYDRERFSALLRRAKEG